MKTDYEILFTKKANKELKKIDKFEQAKIIKYLIKLSKTKTPSSLGCTMKYEHYGYVRYKMGKYRIIVEINNDKLLILVIDVGHRKNIYK